MERVCASRMLVLICVGTRTDVAGDRYVKGGSALKSTCSNDAYDVVCCRVLA